MFHRCRRWSPRSHPRLGILEAVGSTLRSWSEHPSGARLSSRRRHAGDRGSGCLSGSSATWGRSPRQGLPFHTDSCSRHTSWSCSERLCTDASERLAGCRPPRSAARWGGVEGFQLEEIQHALDLVISNLAGRWTLGRGSSCRRPLPLARFTAIIVTILIISIWIPESGIAICEQKRN